MNSNRWLVVGVVSAVVAVGMALAFWLEPQLSVMGTVDGREVTGRVARRLGAARFESDGAVAIVQLGGHRSRVTADQVELSGGRMIRIPEPCRRVELRASRAEVRVFFDGEEPK